jgi:Holliday junction resolvasome RuvABC endonuclease subunit
MTNIIGIDLGLAKMGIVELNVYDDKIHDVHKSLHTSKKGTMSDTGRLSYMCLMATQTIQRRGPEIVVCEYPFNVRGNGRVLVEMFGNIRLCSFRWGTPFIPVAQTTLKKYATGSGKAEKSDMRLQLYKEFGLDYSEDEADAYWLAHLGYSICYGSDKKYRKETAEALKKKHMELPF